MATDRYGEAGVDIDAAHRAVELMKAAVRASYTPQVLTDVGSFGGLFALEGLPAQPVLVASTDGVGTKVKLAAQTGRWQSIGHDIVNHCVNDILVQGAYPLFFLDYIASSKLDPIQVAAVVTGIADACRAAGCALLGGETAEMPGVYAPGAFDVAGTVVGLVDRSQILPRPQSMVAGDLLMGLPSSGPHTNGFSLIRRLVAERELHAPLPGTRGTLADGLLAPHRSYLPEIRRLLEAGVPLKGLAHITGGGFVDNIPRILPDRLGAQIDPQSWPLPRLFRTLVEWAEMDLAEAYRVFNMGIGMVLVVDRAELAPIQALVADALPIGRLIEHQPERARVSMAGCDGDTPLGGAA